MSFLDKSDNADVNTQYVNYTEMSQLSIIMPQMSVNKKNKLRKVTADQRKCIIS